MKLHHFILAGLLSFIFVSCDLRGRQEETPHFGIIRAFLVEQNAVTFEMDTIDLTFNGDNLMIPISGEHLPTRFDTISVNQVVHFETFLFSRFSPIEEFRITSSRARSVDFTWSLPDSLQQRFVDMSATNLDEGIFVARGVYHAFPFNFQYRILEPEDELMLRFTIINGGGRDFNTGVLQFRTPAR